MSQSLNELGLAPSGSLVLKKKEVEQAVRECVFEQIIWNYIYCFQPNQRNINHQ